MLSFEMLKNPDPTDALISAAFPMMPKRSQSLAGPSIDLAYLDTINKRSSEPLQNAIQSAEGNASAREAERRGMASQGLQQGYAAESNARNQLVAKSNELAGKLGELQSSWDYAQNPQKYAAAEANLKSQIAGVNRQLEQSTEAIKRHPAYGGETLVNPVEAGSAAGAEAGDGAADRALAFVADSLRGLSEKDLNNTTFNDVYQKWRAEHPGEAAPKEFAELFASQKKEALENAKNARDIASHIAQFGLSQQEANIKGLQNSTEIATLGNAQKAMRSLGIAEGSDLWNKGIANAGTAGTIGALVQGLGLLKQPAKKQANFAEDF